MKEPAVSVQNLSVSLQRDRRINPVLHDLSFEVGPGKILAVIGQSGSGKTTLGAALQGLLPASSRPKVSGSITLGDIELVGAKSHSLQWVRRNVVRSISQDPMNALNPTMTIRAQLREAARCDDDLIEDWLRRLSFSDISRIARAFPHTLSGGQRQRICIAMALMAKPKVLVADEPTTGLDHTLQRLVYDLIRDAAVTHKTAVIFITHNLSAATAVADSILVLEKGRIVEAGGLTTVLTRPRHAYTQQLVTSRIELETGVAGGTLPHFHNRDRDQRESRKSAALSFQSVSFQYGVTPFEVRRRGRLPVLQSLTLSVAEGECVALVGSSGEGKSTILRIAAGLLRPSAGSVWRKSDSIPQLVFQDSVASLTPWLTIGEQIGERLKSLQLSHATYRRQLEQALEIVGLEHKLLDALPSQMSVGQCQRACLARAIIAPPKLLLCDEPTSSLDSALALDMLKLIRELRERFGMTVLFATHDLAVAKFVANRVAILRDGQITGVGEPERIIETLKATRPSLIEQRAEWLP
ncbi:ABC transporter ATP-binding protein [Pararhizobium arenae]|uniref:ABC transporter ATP-binding protein n=1 Tax=Pararhizobium arenae TaxID=1856850 RepID=UPI00094AB127|nr:ABC transporter ATP-binding protein [Pararhizobium arenae]